MATFQLAHAREYVEAHLLATAPVATMTVCAVISFSSVKMVKGRLEKST